MTGETSQPSLEQQILRELKIMNKILALTNAPKIEVELGKYANTDGRKKMWTMFDGNTLPEDIAKTLGITKRGVDKFLKALEDAGLVERIVSKPPKRLIDYVPASWLDIEIKEAQASQIETQTPSDPGQPITSSQGVEPNG
jgi:hypothetical protein